MDSFSLSPLFRGERVGVRGYGLSLGQNPSPELLRNSTSPDGRGASMRRYLLKRKGRQLHAAAPLGLSVRQVRLSRTAGRHIPSSPDDRRMPSDNPDGDCDNRCNRSAPRRRRRGSATSGFSPFGVFITVILPSLTASQHQPEPNWVTPAWMKSSFILATEPRSATIFFSRLPGILSPPPPGFIHFQKWRWL